MRSQTFMPLDGVYCNALLLSHWSVHQKLNLVSSVQLRRCVRAIILLSFIHLCGTAITWFIMEGLFTYALVCW